MVFGRPSSTPNIDELKEKGDANSLIKALGHRDPSTRWSAASALGEIAGQMQGIVLRSRAVDALSEHILDTGETKTVRWNAVRALGQVGAGIEESGLLTRAIAPLSQALKDPNREMRLAAADALGNIDAQIREPSFITWAVQPLIQSLADTHPRMREVVSRALVNLGDPVMEPLLAALWDKDWKVREGVVEVLGDMGWMPGKDGYSAAYWIVRARWEQCAAIGAAAVEPLVAALQFDNPGLRPALVKTLVQIGAPAVDALVSALRDSQKEVRKAAADALENIIWEVETSEVEAWLWIARQQWRKAVEVGEAALLPLLTVLQDGDPQIRRMAAWSLGKIGGYVTNVGCLTDALDPLGAALHDGVCEVRQAAAEALGSLGVCLPEARRRTVVKALLGALRDEEHDIRSAAATALDGLNWQPERSEDGAAYWIARQDWEKCVEIGGRALKPLQARLLDFHKEIRQGAAAALERLRWKPGRDEIGAAYWVTREEWERCVEIGAAAIRPLSAALRYKDIERQPAAAALGRIGALLKKGDGRRQAVAALCLALNDENLCTAAAHALGEIGDAGAVGALVAALSQAGTLREAAAQALLKTGAPAVRPLVAALEDEASAPAAAETLLQFGSLAVEPLVAALRQEKVAVQAADILEQTGWQPGRDEDGAYFRIVRRQWEQCVEIGAPAVEPLMSAFSEGSETVRQAAAESLGYIAETVTDSATRQRMTRLLLAAFKDWDYGVRRRAAGALERLGWQPGTDETAALYWIIKREWSKVVELGSPALEPLVQTLHDRNLEVRLAAVDALGAMGDPRAVRHLADAMKDRHMRQAASDAIRRIGQQQPRE